MARIRTIKPDFWTDEKIVELTAFARLLFIGLWNFADDDGRMVYSPKKIKMQIFPADSLDITALFGELRRESLINIYVVDGIEYLQIKNFAEHQKIDRRTASKIPAPTEETKTLDEFPRVPPTEWKGMEGNGRERRGRDKSTASSEKISLSPVGVWENISEEQKTVWKAAYPAIALETQLAAAAAWIISNPKNTKSQYARFLNNWLMRAQDKAPRASTTGPPWWATDATIIAKGRELGLNPRPGEGMNDFKGRIQERIAAHA